MALPTPSIPSSLIQSYLPEAGSSSFPQPLAIALIILGIASLSVGFGSYLGFGFKQGWTSINALTIGLVGVACGIVFLIAGIVGLVKQSGAVRRIAVAPIVPESIVPESIIPESAKESRKKPLIDASFIASHYWFNYDTLISDEMVTKVNVVSDYLNARGFKLIGILADGDCFFSAYLESLKKTSKTIPLLKMADNPILFLREQVSAIVGNKNIDRSLEILQEKEWVTANQEGDLLAAALKIPMRLVTVNYSEEGSGVSDTFVSVVAGETQEEWENGTERPAEYIFIVDLGGHFLAATGR